MAQPGQSRGAIIVFSGPSGSGKTTMLRRILDEDPDLVWSVSVTTRAPRPGEADGRDYWFLTREEFERRIEADGFAEWAESFGHLYGTPAAPLADALEKGRVLVLDIDVQGARQIREKFPDAVLVFIRPPDIDVLIQRLEKRHSETDGEFRVRVERARTELNCEGEYDEVIVNDDLDTAVQELRDLIGQIKETGRGEGS